MVRTYQSRGGALTTPPILALVYVLFLLNHTYYAGINGITTTKAKGSTAEISPLLHFHFWKPVYYKVDDSDFPSHSTGKRGRWVGISKHVGHAMTFKLLTGDNQNILFCSKLRSTE